MSSPHFGAPEAEDYAEQISRFAAENRAKTTRRVIADGTLDDSDDHERSGTKVDQNSLGLL